MLIFHIRNSFNQIETGKFLSRSSNKILKLNPDKLLLVGMVDSPHFQKWLTAVQEEFPSKLVYVFPSDRPRSNGFKMQKLKQKKQDRLKLFKLFFNLKMNFIAFYLLDQVFGLKWRAYFLARIIIRHKPSVIHFHEMQHGAYIYNLISNYKKIPTNSRKIISTWGSDLTLYSWIDHHQNQLRACFTWANILTAERTSELLDAKRLGFEGEFTSPLYITLGKDLLEVSKLTNPSSRRIILIKGHQSDTGRALNALQAISVLSNNLANFEIVVYSAPVPVQIQVDLLRNKNKIDIKTIARISNSEMLELFKRARVSISLAVSDGLPAVLVEAMSSGAFPIQSTNSAGSEFLDSNRNGFLVDLWDLDAIRDAILKAVSDDNLVDQAVALNHRLLREKYSLKEGKSKLRQLYL